MVSPDRIPVAVAAEHEHVEVVAAQAHRRAERERAAVDVVAAVGVDEVREAGRAADSRHGHDALVGVLEFLEDLVKDREHGEVAASRAPGRMVPGEVLAGEGLAHLGGGGR
jgi:hypothetical protein